uniref:Uncharacterized protein LOC107425144 n=1 Tax=Rhizophora mucronata TaxID=61149 RepID=A0A2P2MLJ3_RHIMU
MYVKRLALLLCSLWSYQTNDCVPFSKFKMLGNSCSYFPSQLHLRCSIYWIFDQSTCVLALFMATKKNAQIHPWTLLFW